MHATAEHVPKPHRRSHWLLMKKAQAPPASSDKTHVPTKEGIIVLGSEKMASGIIAKRRMESRVTIQPLTCAEAYCGCAEGKTDVFLPDPEGLLDR